MKSDRNSNGYKVPNLLRGLAVLELLAEHKDGLIASDIAKALDAPQNSMGRVLGAMASKGFVSRSEKDNKYALTEKLLKLSIPVMCDRSLIEESLDVMRSLREETGCTILLTTTRGTEGVVLEQMESPRAVRVAVDPGSRYPLYNTAPGKLALAKLADAKLKNILEKIDFDRKTETTITTEEDLKKEIENIRDQGYSVDRAENVAGLQCVACSIVDRHGYHIAELTATAPATQLPESDFEKTSIVVKEHSEMISKKLGWEGF